MQDGQELDTAVLYRVLYDSTARIFLHVKFIKMNLISFSLNKRHLFIPRQVVVASSAFIDPMFVIWDFSKFGSIYEILELKLELINFTTSHFSSRVILSGDEY